MRIRFFQSAKGLNCRTHRECWGTLGMEPNKPGRPPAAPILPKANRILSRQSTFLLLDKILWIKRMTEYSPLTYRGLRVDKGLSIAI